MAEHLGLSDHENDGGYRSPSIMVVDDSENHRTMCRLFLENAGYRVQCAENGAQGLDRARSVPPDLILLDIMMPVMDGQEMLEQLRSDERLADIPVIMVTVESAGSDRLRAFDAGANDYLNKPVAMDELLAKIRVWVRIKRQRESLEKQNRRLQDQKKFLKQELARLLAAPESEGIDAAALTEVPRPEFLAGATVHDFNNMLFRVMGNIELALLETPEDFASKGHLENALCAAGQARQLLRDIPTVVSGESAAADRRAPAEGAVARGSDDIMARSGEHILIVDDEEAIVSMQQQTLERFNYSITPRTSSLEALEDFRRQPDKYNLVITDMVMPGKTGAQLAKDLLAIRPDLPIIMCTGWSETVDAKKAESLGIRSYLKKPVTRLDLARTVRDVLDGNKRGHRALMAM